MAARSSYNEERNLLRIQERERRNQGTFQEKEFYQETVPLFGEPYKTNKGDELSSRIQRMLGSYEDVNNPNTQCLDSSFSKDPQSHVTTKYGGHLAAETERSLHSRTLLSTGQARARVVVRPRSNHSGQPLKKIHGPSSSYTQSSLSLSQGQACPDPHQRKTELWPDLRECQSSSSPLRLSPPQPIPYPPYIPVTPATLNTRTPHCTLRGSRLSPHPDSHFPMVSPLDDPQRASHLRPSMEQPYPLRPSSTPGLQTQPEDFHGQSYHEPLPDLKSTKPSLSKLKIPSQSIETLSHEADCVEDILREMTHSWPPLLTAIQTPSTVEPSKFSFPVKEAQHVPPASPGQ
ncbi:AF4/FMR2 family member 1-like, partial [Oncorhynchus masou masou]|uniref:AF4/FMR2 family member 1-like n=1 Tax=Oncorhynchus masou masou TaxID=90313 RepID=UPI0031840F78